MVEFSFDFDDVSGTSVVVVVNDPFVPVEFFSGGFLGAH